ncbi:MAG: hypothetical protein KGP08_00545 [Xanthomonadaceae bacterium]|nr:hypothetical protein [Xanthomonadaceae bacterium]MDE1884806.1 hypothetical protein [Xanthomonadaceae bacterium]MDE2256814.1 hypothetical protein [Xanthomonadaceae bacterium]
MVLRLGLASAVAQLPVVAADPIHAALMPFAAFDAAIACASVQVPLPGDTVLSFVTVIVAA